MQNFLPRNQRVCVYKRDSASKKSAGMSKTTDPPKTKDKFSFSASVGETHKVGEVSLYAFNVATFASKFSACITT